MKKTGMMNSEISSVISQMGHTDLLVICDSGLPIPNGVKRIDLALKKGLPGFIDTLEAVLEELMVEEVVIASEIKGKNIEVYEEIVSMLEKYSKEESMNVKVTFVQHEQFKAMTSESKAVVRTGECSPYANIILKSGVIF